MLAGPLRSLTLCRAFLQFKRYVAKLRTKSTTYKEKKAALTAMQSEFLVLARTVEILEGKLGAAVRIGKEAFYAQAEMTVDAAYAYTGDVMVQNMLLRDTNEGISAFLDKRTPDWEQ